MRDGFIKVAAGTPQIRVADCRYNAEQIFTLMREADKQGVRVLALPELCLTGYTCGDLFLQDTLLRGAEEGLATILEATKHLDLLAAVGLPVRHQNKLYNCAAVIHRGEILGLVPKTYLPNYGEFYEKRWFEPGRRPATAVFSCCGQEVYLGCRRDLRLREHARPHCGGGDLRGSVGLHAPLRGPGRGGGHRYPQPVRLRRAGGQGRVPPPPGVRPVRPAGVRLCLRQRRGGGVHHRPGLQRPQHRWPRTAPCWPSAASPPGSPCPRWTWSGWPTSAAA